MRAQCLILLQNQEWIVDLLNTCRPVTMPKKHTLLACWVGRCGHALNPPKPGDLGLFPRLRLNEFSLLGELFRSHRVVSRTLNFHRLDLRSGKEIFILTRMQETAHSGGMPHGVKLLNFLRRTAKGRAIQKMGSCLKSPFVGRKRGEHVYLNKHLPPKLRPNFSRASSHRLSDAPCEAEVGRRMVPRLANRSIAGLRA